MKYGQQHGLLGKKATSSSLKGCLACNLAHLFRQCSSRKYRVQDPKITLFWKKPRHFPCRPDMVARNKAPGSNWNLLTYEVNPGEREKSLDLRPLYKVRESSISGRKEPPSRRFNLNFKNSKLRAAATTRNFRLVKLEHFFGHL